MTERKAQKKFSRVHNSHKLGHVTLSFRNPIEPATQRKSSSNFFHLRNFHKSGKTAQKTQQNCTLYKITCPPLYITHFKFLEILVHTSSCKKQPKTTKPTHHLRVDFFTHTLNYSEEQIQNCLFHAQFFWETLISTGKLNFTTALFDVNSLFLLVLGFLVPL